jgi:hypothetical protein
LLLPGTLHSTLQFSSLFIFFLKKSKVKTGNYFPKKKKKSVKWGLNPSTNNPTRQRSNMLVPWGNIRRHQRSQNPPSTSWDNLINLVKKGGLKLNVFFGFI